MGAPVMTPCAPRLQAVESPGAQFSHVGKLRFAIDRKPLRADALPHGGPRGTMAMTQDKRGERIAPDEAPDQPDVKGNKGAQNHALPQMRCRPSSRDGSSRSRTTFAASPASTLSRASVDAAMPTDKVALAELRQANARRIAAIERRLKALEDRAFVDEILSVTVGETEGETPTEKDTVRA